LAEHSGTVAQLALWLVEDLPLRADELLEITRLSLCHDAHETVYGDIPYCLKAEMKARGIDLDKENQDRFWGGDFESWFRPFVLKVVQMADRLEAALYAEIWVPTLADETLETAILEAERMFEDGDAAAEKVLSRVREALKVGVIVER